jgi:hypothetical protein
MHSQKKTKAIVREALWLFGCGGLSFLIVVIGFQILIDNKAIYTWLQSGAFTLPIREVASVVFVFISFITFFIKEWKHRFGRTLSALIIVITGLGAEVLLKIAGLHIAQSGINTSTGWTSYPPLSALPEFNYSNTPTLQVFPDGITTTFLILEILILIALLYVSYCLGKQTDFQDY